MIFFNNKYYSDNIKLHNVLADNFGISIAKAKYVCFKSGIIGSISLKDIDISLLKHIEYILTSFYGFSKLQKRIFDAYRKQQISIGTYRGRRLSVGLPARGQRTHTNAQTAKRLRFVLSAK